VKHEKKHNAVCVCVCVCVCVYIYIKCVCGQPSNSCWCTADFLNNVRIMDDKTLSRRNASRSARSVWREHFDTDLLIIYTWQKIRKRLDKKTAIFNPRLHWFTSEDLG